MSLVLTKDLFTIIIPTKRWTTETSHLVEKINRSYVGIEIICVLNQEIEEEVSTVAKTLVCDDTIAAKRNIAASSVDTEFILFLDSDAEICENALEFAEDRFRKNPSVEVVGGPNLPHPKSSKDQFNSYVACLSPMVGGKARYEKTKSFSREVETVPSCNMYVRTKSYLALGGMNPKMSTAEDLEYCIRVREIGGRVFFDSKVCVYHYTRSLVGFFWQRFTWGYNVFNIITWAKSYKFLYKLVPFMCTVLFIALLVVGCFKTLSFLVSLYFIIIIWESIRLASSFKQLLVLPVYLLVGNMSPAIGTWYYIFNKKYDIYKNYNNSNLS